MLIIFTRCYFEIGTLECSVKIRANIDTDGEIYSLEVEDCDCCSPAEAQSWIDANRSKVEREIEEKIEEMREEMALD